MNNMKSRKYYIEISYPYIAAIIAVGIFIFVDKDKGRAVELVGKLADSAISISVTLVGFFLTILTIINSIESRRMKFVRSGGGMPLLLRYLKNAINSNLLLIAVSFILKYVDCKELAFFNGSEKWAAYLYLFIFAIATFASLRFTNLFVGLLTDPKPIKSPEKENVELP